MEDYLETIFYLHNIDGVVRVRDIAKHMDVKMPSVSDAIKVLKKKKLVQHEPYGHVELTDQGELMARALLMRHQQLTHFFRDLLGVAPDTAEADACRIEHVVSTETMERLLALVDSLQSCSDKKCFLYKKNKKTEAPRIHKREPRTPALSTLKKGQRAHVVSVEEHEVLRRRLVDIGFTRGAEVEMRSPVSQAEKQVRVKGYVITLKPQEAKLVKVETA